MSYPPSIFTSVLLCGLAALFSGCSLPFHDTVIPPDATFEVTCEPRCSGAASPSPGLNIDISFKGVGRRYSLCCEHQAALSIQLRMIEDLWCDGLDVPDKHLGDLLVGATRSELTGARGAAIDDGEGYVAFNCGAWLPKLIDRVNGTDCCRSE